MKSKAYGELELVLPREEHREQLENYLKEHFENNEAIAIGPEIHEISSIYVEKNQDDVEIESNTQVIKPGKILHTTENSTKSISNRINFEDWSFEDTEDELFKDFIQKD